MKSAEMRKQLHDKLKARVVEAHRAELDHIAKVARESAEADRHAASIRLARDMLIVAAVRDGLPMRLIAEYAGISHTIVQRPAARHGIVKRPRMPGRTLPPEVIAQDSTLSRGGGG